MSEARVLGRYEIQAALGKGARAKVYRALDAETQQPVAIKVLRPDAVLRRALEPFRESAKGLARLRHPGIARFIAMSEADGKLLLVFELAEGKSLAALLADGSRPELKNAWHIARQILEALEHAHGQGFVHGDLKPENVMLGPGGHVMLTDFGISTLYALPGPSVQYFSPEHFAGGKLTSRSDIYQAAAIVYQLVTGQLPFAATADIESRIAKERPQDPSSHNNHLAWQLDFVVQKALAKRPEDRYVKAMDFAEGLRLGLQDTIGRPLEPAHGDLLPSEPAAPSAAAPAAVPAAPPSAPPAAPPAAVPAAPPAAPPAPAPAAAPPAPSAPKSPLLQNASLLAPKPSPAPAAPAAPPAAQPQAPAAAASPAASGKPGVLFVDDDERILNALRMLFRQDYAVETAEGGEAAIGILQRGGIQVIVSDQRMPGMTGVELLRKARVIAPNAIRILLTGYTDLASLVGSINQGEISRFVMKPWDNDELRKALAEAVGAAAELAAAAPPAKPSAPRSAGSLLVIDRSEGMARGLERLLAGEAQVIRVDSAAEAVKVLAKEEVAAVVADGETGMDALVVLFRELKAKRPGIRSILLTAEPDSDIAIDLINNAHIFRLLPKPVSARDLRTQVAEALRRYASYKQAIARTAQVAA
jgi:eukaryotic-like serine/threonine-protein kinase